MAENHNPSAPEADLDAVPQDEEAPPSYFAVINDPKSSREVARVDTNLYNEYTVPIPDTATTELDRVTNHLLLNDSGIEFSNVSETVLEPLTATSSPRSLPKRKAKWGSKCGIFIAAVLILICILAALSVSVYNSAQLQRVSGKMKKDHQDLQKLKMLVGDLGQKFSNVSENLLELEVEFRNISAGWIDASEKIKVIDQTILEMLEQVEVKYEAMGRETVDYLEDLKEQKIQRNSAGQLRLDTMVSVMIVWNLVISVI